MKFNDLSTFHKWYFERKRNRENILCKLKPSKPPYGGHWLPKKNHIYEFEAIYFSLRDIHFLDFTVMIKTKKILSSNQIQNKSKDPNNNPNLFHASIVKNYTKSRTLNPKRRLDIRPFS